MSKLNDKLHERAELIHKMRALIDAAEKAGRDMASEECEQYARMETAVDALDKTVAQLRKQEALEASLAVITNPMQSASGSLTDSVDLDRDPARPLAMPQYRRAFDRYCRVGRNGLVPQVLAALQIGTESEGGYLVPEEFETMLTTALIDHNEIRAYARTIATSGDRHIPIEDTLGTATWTAEEDPYSESDAAFDRVTLGAHKLGTILKVSEELLMDAFFDMESYLAENFGKRFGLAEEAAFVNGDGNGKPAGIVQGSTLGATAAATGAITSDEVIDLYHGLARPYRPRATWILNDDTVKAIRKLKDDNLQYLWQPGLQAGEPDRILGRPMISSTAMPTMQAAAKTMIFGDLSYYVICDRGTTRLQRLNELYAANGQVGFRGFKRVDGAVTLPVAIKHLVQAAT